MNRRGFLSSVIALGASPAIVRAESLMKLWVPSREILTRYDGWEIIEISRNRDVIEAVKYNWQIDEVAIFLGRAGALR